MAERTYIIHQYDLSVIRCTFILYAFIKNHAVLLHVCGFVFPPYSFCINITYRWLLSVIYRPYLAQQYYKVFAAYGHGCHGTTIPSMSVIRPLTIHSCFTNHSSQCLRTLPRHIHCKVILILFLNHALVFGLLYFWNCPVWVVCPLPNFKNLSGGCLYIYAFIHSFISFFL